MSQKFFAQYQESRERQLQRNDARKIRGIVASARNNIEKSAKRWPFELVQNALDPGTRVGRKTVSINLSFDGTTLVFEHDGRLFNSSDLAALLSGGSNKDFDSTETTGRFGTGFLQTHSLSERITFRSLIECEGSAELATLNIDRSGDEERIFDNMEACNYGIKQAEPIANIDGTATARFSYHVDRVRAAELGINLFLVVLPVLFATCERLGTVVVANIGATPTSFTPSETTTKTVSKSVILERIITASRASQPDEIYKAIRIKSEESPVSIVVILRLVMNEWEVLNLSQNDPRAFVRFPVPGSEYFPFNFRVDGLFDLPTERDNIPLDARNQQLLTESLKLLPLLLKTAVNERWKGGLLLNRIAPIPDELVPDADQRKWLLGILRTSAEEIARLPIVQVSDGRLLPALTASGVQVTFIDASKDLGVATSSGIGGRVWSLANECRDTFVPAIEVSEAWTALANDWKALGVPVRLADITFISGLAKRDAKSLEQLGVTVPPIKWLRKFLAVLAELSLSNPKLNVANLTNGLLPNQHLSLRSSRELARDTEVPERLKEIATTCGLDVKAGLLALEILSDDSEAPQLRRFVQTLIERNETTRSVIEQCIRQLDAELPESKPVAGSKAALKQGSIDLFAWLVARFNESEESVKKLPLIAVDNTSIRWGLQRRPLAPVKLWPPAAQMFSEVYAKERILADEYAAIDDAAVAFDALHAADFIYSKPLTLERPRELKSDRLRAMGFETAQDVALVDEVFSQIPYLATELVQRSGRDESLARVLLGMALSYASNADDRWIKRVSTPVRMGKDGAALLLTRALWVADLKSKPWVPVKGSEGTLVPVIANSGNLAPFLDRAWLINNEAGIRLLVDHFQFRELDLRLIASTEQNNRPQLEAGLAKIVQSLGGDPAKYAELASQLETQEQREKEKQRNRRFGLAVQAAIAAALDARGLHLDFIDVGYDYDLYVDDIPMVEAGTHHFRLGDHLLEIKATTSGEVRLTPMQAETAVEELERFILCVVDLRDISQERMEGEWTAADVVPRAKFLTKAGSTISQPHELVMAAAECAVGLRNESALRYAISPEIWDKGISLDAWVTQIFQPPSA